ncbi:glycoside hydrolase family 13 protein [Sphaerobolus stellatus SS14]|nr:glycoside hydrolase family 13 protein [Sphaerobolus stellatus SS14]
MMAKILLCRGAEETTWWQMFEQELPRLQNMGFTQAWLPPPNKGMTKDGRGYDAYDLWDLGEFNQKDGIATRWGDKEQLLKASQTAKEHGIGMIIDAVLNHKLGADRVEVFKAVEVDPQDRNVIKGPVKEIEGWTAYDFPGRGTKLPGVDWDHRSRTEGIFRIEGKGKKGWSKRVDKENGNYDYLLGRCTTFIDHRHPDVRNDFLSWGPWVLETVGSNGFRLDAIKHMDRKFVLEFVCVQVRNARKHGHRDLFVVAECWSDNYVKIKRYIQALQGEVSFFDVPLHYNFYRAGHEGPTYDLRKILDNTIVQNRPGDAVTFVDNHESQVGQTLESWVEGRFKLQAYALILLRIQGYPCVFYGDLYPCSFYDPDIGRVLKDLIRCRRQYAYGPQTDYIASSPHHDLVGFTREGLDTRPNSGCAVLLSNGVRSTVQANDQSSINREDTEGGMVSLKMNLGKRNSNKVFRNVLGDLGGIKTDEQGWGIFRCLPGQAAVWVSAESIQDNTQAI